ncbi:MAG: DUF3262 family protein [Burkholderiales bacterium]|jgi:hypothetical protein|uniref:hypothetical protein n=1 Tax=Roseateles sp. TaxID=1971397 RepID=UPI000FBEA169|nr:hypothetical protein [Burkholderiaceae bacterium]RTL18336.1 MAG: DUF3262 family protein [Burkholderiales bacterium]
MNALPAFQPPLMPLTWLSALRRHVGRCLGALLMLAGFGVLAAGTCADFLNALAQRESGMNASVVNPYGYVGLFQMGEAALIDAGYYRPDGTGANDWRGGWTGKGGITSLSDFKSNPQAQIAAVTAYEAKQWSYIQSKGLDQYIGQTIGGVEITRSGLIAGAHLVGVGNLGKFLWSNGATVPVDGNRVPISQYIAQFGGYQLTGAGNNCSSMLSGTPTGGVPIVAPPTGGNGPVYAPGVPADSRSPEQAFYGSTGVGQSDVAMTIKLIVAALLMVIVAHGVLSNWHIFSRGRMPWAGFKHNNTRLFVMATMVFVLLM